MIGGPRGGVEVRRVPGGGPALSALAVAVDPPAVAPPSLDAQLSTLLQRARERGVTTFDLADARFPARAERLLSRAFPIPDPDLGVIVGRSKESLAAEGASRDGSAPARDLETASRASLEASRRRLAPLPISVVEWRPDLPASSDTRDEANGLPPLAGSAEGPQWAVRLALPWMDQPAPEHATAVFGGELSLLDHRVIPWFESRSTSSPAWLIARNVFSNGRLDGSRFAAVSSLAGPGMGPVDVRRLHSEFDPVLSLGFLTEGRRRTMAQAALHFVLGWPWVVTAVVPLPDPHRMDEILGFAASPPLSDEEKRRLDLVK